MSEDLGCLSVNQGFGESLKRIDGRSGVILTVIGFWVKLPLCSG